MSAETFLGLQVVTETVVNDRALAKPRLPLLADAARCLVRKRQGVSPVRAGAIGLDELTYQRTRATQIGDWVGRSVP
jgi:hypothetical protein